MNEQDRARRKVAFRSEFEPTFRALVDRMQAQLQRQGVIMSRLEILDLCDQRIPLMADVLVEKMGVSGPVLRDEVELRKEVLHELIADLRRPLIN